MILSDVSVKRPVFATVISLLLVAFGILSFTNLPLRELPNIDPPVVSIDTRYRGASAAVIENRITYVIEEQIAGIEGIKTITATSRDGRSQINIEFDLSRDIDAAANDVRDAVSRMLGNLPDDAEPPEVSKADADSDVIMWINLADPSLTSLELTDFGARYVLDRLSAVPGVARVNLSGGQIYAMRIWLDRRAMAARGLTAGDIESALRANNVELPAGRIEADARDLSVRMDRVFQTPDDFRALKIGEGANGEIIRLGDVARVELGAVSEKVIFRGNGQPQVGLGIVKQSTANTLDVGRGVREEIARIQEGLPEGMELVVSFDSSVFVEAAVDQVYWALGEAMVIVVLVIFIFLGSIRAALIPAVTVPVCIIGAFLALNAFGLSINLLTLLAFVLAIGIVVDDSIVVLENIQRRMMLGEPPLIASARGAGQVGFAVIATTTVLVVVFVPLLFLTGNVGRLFSELAIAIASAVAISGLVALTLTPMMCSKLLKPASGQKRLARRVHTTVKRIENGYVRILRIVLRMPLVAGAAVGGVIFAIISLIAIVPSELAPNEDRGGMFINVQGPEGGTFEQSAASMEVIEGMLMKLVERGDATRILVRVPGSFGFTEDFNSGFVIVPLADWDQRTRTQDQIIGEVTGWLQTIPGMRAFASGRQGLGQRGGQPVQFVLGGSDTDELLRWRDRILARARENPRLVNADSDLRETKPLLRVTVNRERAADLGVSVASVGQTLETMLGSRRVTTFVDRGEEYDVILQAESEDRASIDDLTNIFVRANSGALVSLANLVDVRETAGPTQLNRFNRLRSVTISAALAEGYPLGEALAWLEDVAREELPPTARIDYRGQSRELREASSDIYLTFALALVVVFLVLAAQFESFVHPAIILLTVPLAVAGALAGLWLIDSSLNIYSQIGIVILIGLASKNGILIVEFANQLRDEGKSFMDAIVEASAIRFRPIVMTSLSTAFGALPLVVATGAGAASRETIGIVIFAGVIGATVLTLFIVPVAYAVIARRTKSPGAIAAEMAEWEARENAGAARTTEMR